jgi:hypothetical protein
MRCTPVRCTFIKYTPIRYTPMRYTLSLTLLTPRVIQNGFVVLDAEPGLARMSVLATAVLGGMRWCVMVAPNGSDAGVMTFTTDGTNINFFAHYAAPSENGTLKYHPSNSPRGEIFEVLFIPFQE